MRYAFPPLALALLPVAAMAQVPRFDVEAHCNKIANFGGSYSAEMYNFCIEQEQTAYNVLKPTWGSIPAEAAAHCERIATFGGDGSYEMLKFCIEEETAATANKKSFSF